MKSLIYAAFRWRYLNSVQTDSAASPAPHKKKLTETSMTFSRIETAFDRIAPALLLGLGLIASLATAGLGI